MLGQLFKHTNQENLLKEGSEKGFFKFGGSTIIILIKKVMLNLMEIYYIKQN